MNLESANQSSMDQGSSQYNRDEQSVEEKILTTSYSTPNVVVKR